MDVGNSRLQRHWAAWQIGLTMAAAARRQRFAKRLQRAAWQSD